MVQLLLAYREAIYRRQPRLSLVRLDAATELGRTTGLQLYSSTSLYGRYGTALSWKRTLMIQVFFCDGCIYG